MKIAYEKSKDLPLDCLNGWVNAFQSLGHEVIAWNKQERAVFDLFDYDEPDLCIFSLNSISRGLATCLKDYEDVRLALYCNPSLISKEDTENLYLLYNDVKKPNLLFNFSTVDNLGWLGLKHKSFSHGIDTTLQATKVPSDYVAYFGDFSESLSDAVLHFVERCPYPLRIFGNNWPVSNCVGLPQTETKHHIYSSAKLIVDFHADVVNQSILPFEVSQLKGRFITNDPQCPWKENIFHNLEDLYLFMKNIDQIKIMDVGSHPTCIDVVKSFLLEL